MFSPSDILQAIKKNLPHGSGINKTWEGDFFICKTGNYYVFKNAYQKMDDNGFYTGWVDFCFYVYPFKMTWKLTGLSRNEDLKDYLEELFHYFWEENKTWIASSHNIPLFDEAEFRVASNAVRFTLRNLREEFAHDANDLGLKMTQEILDVLAKYKNFVKPKSMEKLLKDEG